MLEHKVVGFDIKKRGFISVGSDVYRITYGRPLGLLFVYGKSLTCSNMKRPVVKSQR